MDWSCPHGVGPESNRGDCVACNEELATRAYAGDMTPDQRADEVRDLLQEISAYRIEDIQKRIDELVGRPVWTHELSTPLVPGLIEEARTGRHPENLNQHAIDSLRSIMGDKPIIVVDPGEGS